MSVRSTGSGTNPCSAIHASRSGTPPALGDTMQKPRLHGTTSYTRLQCRPSWRWAIGPPIGSNTSGHHQNINTCSLHETTACCCDRSNAVPCPVARARNSPVSAQIVA